MRFQESSGGNANYLNTRFHGFDTLLIYCDGNTETVTCWVAPVVKDGFVCLSPVSRYRYERGLSNQIRMIQASQLREVTYTQDEMSLYSIAQ